MSRLAIDVDGVLVDFNSSYSKLLMKIDPSIKLPYLESNWPLTWDYDKEAGFSSETIAKAWTEIENSGLFWRSLFPYSTAYADLKFLHTLRKEHDIYFVTTRGGKTAKQETEVWLAGHMFPEPTVVICDQKSLFCEAVDIDFIVDDKIDTIQDVALDGSATPILFKRPYNQQYWGKYKSVDSIREALKDAL